MEHVISIASNINFFRDEIKAEYGPQVLLNDPAHRWEHFEDVFQTGILINDRLNLDFSQYAILTVAYFHDLFAWSRVNHHRLSGEFISGTDSWVIEVLLNEIAAEGKYGWTKEMARREIADACRCHRASFKGEFPSLFAEMMNGADRGVPGKVDDILTRAFEYTLHNEPNLYYHDVPEVALKHIKEKFGTGGYARYSDLYQEVFAQELEQQRRHIDDMSLWQAEGIYHHWGGDVEEGFDDEPEDDLEKGRG